MSPQRAHVAFNRTDDTVGGADLRRGPTPILDSTTSSNAHWNGVRLNRDDPTPAIVISSTIAFNHEQRWDACQGAMSSGTQATALPLPPDALSGDPRLAQIADNGGPTRTHALLSDSPAIDAGNNVSGLGYDQGGAAFPRVNGARADIGAFER